MPDAMSFEHGAAFGVVYQTSYFGLVYRADLRPGETLLVHAAAGGVGLAAVQIGAALGARVLATAGSAAKLAVARQHGAEQAFDYSTPDWVEGVKQATGGRGADVSTIRSAARSSTVHQVHRLQRPAAGRRLRVGRHPDDPAQSRAAEEHCHRRPALGRLPHARPGEDPAGDGGAVRDVRARRGAPVVSSQYPLAEAAKALR
jgi:NADPH:quinone reductase-like Zn-dependent oxidoreductase